MRILFLLFSASLSWSLAAQHANVKLLSWNIRDFGQRCTNAEIDMMAQVVRGYDVIAIQEVVAIHRGGAQAVARLVEALDRTGNDYDYRISDPTKSSSKYTSERYAFIWKTSNIKIHGRPKLLSAYEKEIEREPYMAEFSWHDKHFRVLNLHARPHNQNPEQELSALKGIPDKYNEMPLFLLGDFNLVSRHTVFNPWIKRGYRLAVENQKTTLKKKLPRNNNEDPYSREKDNILVPAHQVQLLEGGVLDVLAFLGGDLDAANALSDHVPVYAVFDDYPQLEGLLQEDP